MTGTIYLVFLRFLNIIRASRYYMESIATMYQMVGWTCGFLIAYEGRVSAGMTAVWKLVAEAGGRYTVKWVSGV